MKFHVGQEVTFPRGTVKRGVVEDGPVATALGHYYVVRWKDHDGFFQWSRVPMRQLTAVPPLKLLAEQAPRTRRTATRYSLRKIREALLRP